MKITIIIDFKRILSTQETLKTVKIVFIVSLLVTQSSEVELGV